ncbi:hypothetical protein ACIOMM_19240 [Streptomyces sp. NPDC087908]|uniref:hypothetical protein n=1 Tax=Streptomyces sp. NPDC087908 TaxID=3365820 RepID=UPI003816CC2C
MTPHPLPHLHPADDDMEPDDIRPTAAPRPGPSREPVVSSPPTLDAPPLPDAPKPYKAPQTRPVAEQSATNDQPPAPEPPTADQPAAEQSTTEPPATADQPAADQPAADPEPPTTEEPATEDSATEESGDEAVHTLLRTAATERPVEEVAALVARLQETGELSSPADVALRAAAVSRPLDEVRELLVLLNASGYDLHEAETALRAAAVGRPVEDVVRLVGILGSDSAEWRPAGGGDSGGGPNPAPGPQDRKAGGAAARAGADPASAPKKRDRGAAKGRRSTLDGALASGPGSHVATPALRSVLRWPAALALFACGLIHLPTDLAGLRSGGDAQALSAVVSVLCLACAIWLAARDTLIAWAAATGAAVFVIAVHGVASARTADLLGDSLGTTFAWAKALALLSAVGIVCLAASALVRHARTSGAPDGA